jgi:protein arginine kinase
VSQLGDLARRTPAWLGGAAVEPDIVLSSRVRLARNVRGWTFPHATGADRLCELRDEVLEVVVGDRLLASAQVLLMEDLDDLDLGLLRERHLISADLARTVLGRGLTVTGDETCALMVNEEDHLRIQAFAPGLDPSGCLGRASQVARSLEDGLGFVVDDRLGYLTACPTNVGTGMRASALMHLPALVLTGDLERVLNSLRRLDFAVRGTYGEGSGAMGALFQISNSVTLGRSEGAIVEDLLVHAGKVVECERQARLALFERDRVRLEDRVWRSRGLLAHARLLSTGEALAALSDLRLGLSLKILPAMDAGQLNALQLEIQGAHLQVRSGGPLEAPERDELRATLIRQRLDVTDEGRAG